MFGSRTDPLPFIQAAYGLGILFIVVYAALQLKLRNRLRALERAVQDGGGQS